MKICEVCGNKGYAPFKGGMLVCRRHYGHLIHRGKILIRTKYDKNEIFDRGDYLEMALYNNKSEIVAYTKFDKEDLDKIKVFKWRLINTGHVGGDKKLLLHRLIMDCPKKLDVDHIFGDSLDNRKSQLRLATRAQNIRNSKIQKHSSIYKGVQFYKAYGTWMCRIVFNRKSIFIGYFKEERHAGMAYDIWAKELFGEFAKLNFPIL